MTKTALVTGATGLLGRQVLVAFHRAGWNTVGTGFSRAKPPTVRKVDLSDTGAVSSLLDEAKPEVVVHCAANRFPDKCDADPEGAHALNVEATRCLFEATSSRGIFLIYISTDYVFPGLQGEAPYEADAFTKAPNLYGQTKLDGEKAVLAKGGRPLSVVLRVPVLYGKAENPKESAINMLFDTIWEAQEKNAKMIMDDWAQRYPTNTEDVGRVCKDIAIKYLEAEDDEVKRQLPRILQFTSEDRFTKYEICQLLAEIMGLPLAGISANKAGNDPTSSVQRPYDTHLSTKRLRDLGIDVHTQDFQAWWRWELGAVRR